MLFVLEADFLAEPREALRAVSWATGDIMLRMLLGLGKGVLQAWLRESEPQRSRGWNGGIPSMSSLALLLLVCEANMSSSVLVRSNESLEFASLLKLDSDWLESSSNGFKILFNFLGSLL
jgi:hypothetical protein